MNRVDFTPASPEPLTEQEIQTLPIFQDAGDVLALTALGLIGVFLFTMLGTLLSPQWIDPRWQMAQIERLIHVSSLPLIALALLMIAAHLAGTRSWVQNGLALCRSLARLACCGYLLLIPLQLMATGLQAQHLAIASPQPARALISIQEQIGALTSLDEELRETLRHLPSTLQPKTADQRSLPVVRLELQQQLHRRLRALEKKEQQERKLQRLDDLVKTLRVSVVSLILAMVYSGVAMGRPERGSWLQQLVWGWEQRQDARRERLRSRLELQAEMDAIRLHYSATDLRAPVDGDHEMESLQAPRSRPWPWSKRADPHPEQLTGAGAHPDDRDAQEASAPRPTRRQNPAAAAPRRGRWPARNRIDSYLEELADAADREETGRNAAADDHAGRGV